ncbi:methionine ABC transporter ATP-binding protein [Planococcus sp. N028]|uniref:Methionine ABC transporter ATP-binding protein n=1 Tax=Planococcus shixiaomingii TaxID=3058393 RepID=A0ABT8MZB3_9BACL|nr:MULTISPECIES: methionine ABC transporter ATP-binding protein [unclassified Planococcus (in: firmicutes)]MDN7240988.1 methionine ABC transporter ATP-binding protein [Planococcus sp. N028]WKA53242.1 methionine ABC transporter ATP-binding protein [Planococcus sp. N022]
MISIQNLSKDYKTKKGTVTGVDNVSLTVQEGEVFGIVGYSGAGKSSLLRCINLLERPTSGEIFVDGVDLTKLKGEGLRQARLKIGMIFQHFYLISQKTVAENIAFALKAANLPKVQADKRVEELLDMVGLAEKRDVYPAQLSGGQKQRVGIARALANNPSVLLCDEATSALDPNTTLSILRLLKKINRELNITIVLITHEMNVVKEICDRMAIMQEGRVIEEGEVYELFSSPKTDLTKEFISSVVSFDVPAPILAACTGSVIKVQFKGAVAGEGIITDTVQNFDVKGNFLHGSIEYIQEKPLGLFLMEIQGRPDNIHRAITYMEGRGANVEVILNGI